MTGTVEATSPSLRGQVRGGLVWSGLSSLLLRGGNLLLGIVLARLLAPEDFGVFAVALTVQAILMTLTDLGMGADLVRAEHPERRAPTVATLSLLSGAVLTASMVLTAGPVATAMGSADAAPVVVVLSFTLLLSGASVVPVAYLTRDFQQKKLFVSEGVNFALSTAVAVGLVLAGAGPMALAVSRLVGQAAGTTLQFVLLRMRPVWGFDRAVARTALRFGLPLAAANMLSWALLNIDNVVVSRTSGVVALGFYVLAFNVSSWPMTAIGAAIRPVTLAAFARQQHEDPAPALRRATALSAAAAAPVGVLLAVLALPVVTVLYGERWAPSAAALAGLALFGGLRIVLDMLATFLIARGAVSGVLWIQVAWTIALVPAMVLGVRWGGLAGAGWAHLVVGVVLVLPAYLGVLRRAGAPVGAVLGSLWQPVLAMAPAGLAGQQVTAQIGHPALAALAGGTVALLLYAAVLQRWVRGRLSDPEPAPPGLEPSPALAVQR
ncbi:oligosaccharide flippase family protein [Blastococcus sp. TF02-9]|uniref:oligosaccharide flippase family protein n=1 Tax=Blastococcus sp. TF02-09 TaxID=2250576 RepID=UPI0011BF839C|nr:oligosaccharide flippase family protein [Blastococcus sp. TF02-9]